MERIAASLLALSFGSLLCLAAHVLAAAVDKDLEGIKKKIEQEKQSIKQVQKKEGSTLQALGKIQGDLEKKTKALSAANSKLDSIIVEMRKKETEAEKSRLSLQQRREMLRTRAVALYRWQRGGSPFVILNGDVSLGAVLQRKRYLEATLAFDHELIAALNDEVARQENLKKELIRKKEEVDEQRQMLAEVKDSVQKKAEEKRHILASLRQEKETRVRALKELEQAALRLERMMDEIAKKSASKPQDVPSGGGLELSRGRFDWPVKGAVTGMFGKTRHPEFAAEVFRKGIDIEAPIGEQIKAIEKGRVVFADRFSGYGKMLIIDHGERFYTIYAHLSEFLKRNGDPVKRGEPIARVGDSDSLAGAKLYFEMRKDGKSIDPLPWFRR